MEKHSTSLKISKRKGVAFNKKPSLFLAFFVGAVVLLGVAGLWRLLTPADPVAVAMLTPTQWKNAQGESIRLYNYRFQKLEENGSDEYVLLFETIPHPAGAETQQECQVLEYPALAYKVGDRAYLLWQPEEGLILALDYNPAALSWEEALKMAESCQVPR